MALAISSVTDFKDCGQEFRATINIAASGTYTTGGQVMSFKNTKIKTASLPTFGIGFSAAGHLAAYDVANNKILLWNGTTQFTSGGDLTDVTACMTFFFPKA
jgi:hypothetical protein